MTELLRWKIYTWIFSSSLFRWHSPRVQVPLFVPPHLRSFFPIFCFFSGCVLFSYFYWPQLSLFFRLNHHQIYLFSYNWLAGGSHRVYRTIRVSGPISSLHWPHYVNIWWGSSNIRSVMLCNVMYCSLSYLLCQIVHLSNIKCGFSELYCIVLCCAVLCCAVLRSTVCTVLHCTSKCRAVLHGVVLCRVVSCYALTPIDSNCAFPLQNEIIIRFIVPLYPPLHYSSSAFYHF